MSLFEKHPKKTSFILIFILVIGIDLLAAALFTSTGIYKPQHEIEKLYRIKHENFHHTLASKITYPNARWGPNIYTINTNSLGFKDKKPRDISLKKSNERILIIGDSLTEGIGYEYRDTFAGIIDKKLKEKNIDVLNAGVSSYSPIIYLRKVQHLLDKGLEFNHLIVFLDISDIEDESTQYMFDANNNVIYQPNAKYLNPGNKIKQFFDEKTILISTIRKLIQKEKKEKTIKLEQALNLNRGLWSIKENVYNDYAEKGLKQANKHMTMLATLLKNKNIKLTLAVYPWPDQIFYKDLNSIQVSYWKKWAQKNNTAFINLFPIFINSTDPKEIIKKYYILGDVHWNKEGHKLVAKSVLPQL